MTVAELIEILKGMPQDAPVVWFRDGQDVTIDRLEDIGEVWTSGHDELSDEYWSASWRQEPGPGKSRQVVRLS